jgi:excisionase family DNA binding protein
MHCDETLLAVGIPEAARRLGLSARTVAALVLSQELPSRKVGRRRIIPIVALEAFVRCDRGNSKRSSRRGIEEIRPQR